MVSPGTHLVKNHESQSRTIKSQFKKQCVPGSFVTTQLTEDRLQNSVLQFTEIKIFSFYRKAQQRLKEITVV